MIEKQFVRLLDVPMATLFVSNERPLLTQFSIKTEKLYVLKLSYTE